MTTNKILIYLILASLAYIGTHIVTGYGNITKRVQEYAASK